MLSEKRLFVNDALIARQPIHYGASGRLYTGRWLCYNEVAEKQQASCGFVRVKSTAGR
ncbi:MAG TPA: hypothetical protein VMU02_07320 [bacterium]|nr:hypothetical protein [bacterium]